MVGASFEATLELWASSLRAVKARMRPLFRQARTARSAGLFLDGLLGPERRKTGWMRAEAAGDPGPWRQQAVLGRGRWEADALRDVVRDYALEALAAPDAVLVIDETGFLKQGKASCGVARQYTGSAGKITNCQIGVFAAYVSRHGHALIDRALYLPKAWTDDPARRAAAHIPDAVAFATKPRLALGMVERAVASGVPFAWVAADTVYGVGEGEMALRRAGKGYVLGVTGGHHVHSWGVLPAVAGTAEGGRGGAAALRLAPTLGRRGHEGAAAARLGLPRTRPPRGGRVRRGRRGPLDARAADPAPHRRWRTRPFHHLVPQGHPDRDPRRGRGAALGHRGRLRDGEERARARPQRDPVLARLAPPRLAGDARLRHPRGHPPSRERGRRANRTARESRRRALVRWSLQEIRRVAARRAQRRIQPARVIAWSAWRRAHQASAQRSHLRRKSQL
jgi:DDE superfamily endonuclease